VHIPPGKLRNLPYEIRLITFKKGTDDMKKSLIILGVIVILIAGIAWAVHTFDLAGFLKKMHGG
jgi:hypothetical protein